MVVHLLPSPRALHTWSRLPDGSNSPIWPRVVTHTWLSRGSALMPSTSAPPHTQLSGLLLGQDRSTSNLGTPFALVCARMRVVAIIGNRRIATNRNLRS